MQNPVVKSNVCKTFHTEETKKNSMMNDVNFIKGTRLYLSSKPPVAFGDVESFPSEHDFSMPYVNTPLDVNASSTHEYTGDNAARRGDVQFTGKLAETSGIEGTDRSKGSIRDKLAEIIVDNHFKVIKQLTQQYDSKQQMRSESDRNDAKICLPGLKTSGENRDSLGVNLVSEGTEEELHQHQEFLSAESPADTDESDTVLDNSSAIHSSGSLKKNICNNSINRKGRNVAFGSSSAVSTGVGSVGSFQSNNDEAAQLCSGSVEVIQIQQYQQNNVSKATMGRGCIYNTSNEMLVEKEKITIGTDLRRVRFSGEDVWSYYCGPVQFPSMNSPAVASCDPSLCYSLSMASLEATAGGPTNIASDIYSRWGVAPLPDGCSYESSWSQALLQSIPLFSRCGKNQSPLSTSNQNMGDMTISTLAGLSPSAKYYGRSPPKPRLFNNMLYLCRNSRCSAPATPQNSSLSTVPAKGCSTTTNAACRKGESLDDLTAAMSAAVTQIESHEYKDSKEKSNNVENKFNRAKSPTILPDTVLHKLQTRQACLSQDQQLSTESNHAAIYNKKKHTHHPVIDKINSEHSKSLIKHDFISETGSQVDVANSEISYPPRGYAEQNCPSGASTMLKIVLPILKRNTGLSRDSRSMSNASPTSGTNNKGKVMIGLWGSSSLIGKLSRNNSGSSNSDVSGGTCLSANSSSSAISKAWHSNLRAPHQYNTTISNKSHDETSAVTQGKSQDFMVLKQSGVSSCSDFRDSLDMHCMLKSLKNGKGWWKDGHLCVTSSDDTVLEKQKYNEISEGETQNNNSGKSDDSPSPSASCRSCWGSRRHRKSSRCSQFSARVSGGLSVLKRTCSKTYTSAQTQAHTPTGAVTSCNTRAKNSCVTLLQKEICEPALGLARKQKCSYTARGTVMPSNLQYGYAGRVPKLTEDNNKEDLDFISAGCSNAALPYDLEFGNLKVKLHKKLSAKCHCQFDVWEAEVTQITDSEKMVAVDSNIGETINEDLATKLSGMLDMSNIEKLKVGSRFALKLLEIDSCETSKLKYKTYSITAEGRQLKNLYGQMHERECSVIKRNASDTDNQKKSSLMVIPIPKYYWTGSGYRKSAGTKVLGVAMELIQGRSLTQILQQLRCPVKQSVALLAIEIALKIVQSQQVLVGGLAQPLINWDTKPGNILLELIRSTSGRLHCRRAVIIDLGDALPGPEYWFPTRHRPGETPGYIICTKGYCSPECAVLVFLLASSSRCGSFRKVWYGENAQIERLQEARKQRLPYRWRQWVKEGFLRRTCMNNNVTSSQRSTNINGTCSSSFNRDGVLSLVNPPSVTENGVNIGGSNTHNSSEHQGGRIDRLATRQRSCSSSSLFHGTSLMNGYAKNELGGERNLDKGDQNKVTLNAEGAKLAKNKIRVGSDDASKWFENNNINKMNEKHQKQQENHNVRGDRGYWEVNFTEKSVVFSTGLVLAQLFGGPNLLQVVEKDEVRALDLLCEWGFCDSVNYYSGRMNLGPKHLLPSAGVFSEEPWRSKVLTLLENCLAFVPSKRWTFCEIHVYLLKMYEEYITAYNANKKTGIVNAIHQATTFRVKKN